MLTALRERHGGARAFLRAQGVTSDIFDAVEARLLEERR
jgi:hypothetical protein